MRAVLDPNVLIASLLSRDGAPTRLVSSWLTGAFELIVSESLLEELERALTYPKLRDRVNADEAVEFVALLRHTALLASDPPTIAFTATSVAQSMRATGFEAAEIVRCNPGDAADRAASLDSVALH